MDIRAFLNEKPNGTSKSRLRNGARKEEMSGIKKSTDASSSNVGEVIIIDSEDDLTLDSVTQDNKDNVDMQKSVTNEHTKAPISITPSVGSIAQLHEKQSRPPAPCSGCLNGKKIALTGNFHQFSRGDMIHFIKSCGGSISSSVTRITNFLLHGHQSRDGTELTKAAKYTDAVQKNIRIINEQELYNMVAEARSRLEMAKPSDCASYTTKVNGSNSGENYLWVDKYKPVSLEETIGNNDLGKKLKQWLIDWDDVHVKKTRIAHMSAKLSENRGAKTALLSGPPGIGKTTMAALVSKECGFECVEFNASDTRSKKILHASLGDILSTQVLTMSSKTRAKKQQNHLGLGKRVVIMDEVDGMSGGDRGGMAELLQLIKNSKVPVICICNDRQSPKVRSLASHSYDLRLRRPTKMQIAKRLMEIGVREGLTIERNAMEEAIERCGNDIRQLLMQMQKWRLTQSRITYADMISHSHRNKDQVLRLNPFSATQQIFQQDTSYAMRTEAYFVDYDLLPLMIQENYVKSIISTRKTNDEKLEAITRAADFIAEGDIVNNFVRGQQRWDLLTKQAALNVAACVCSSGFIGHPEFSKWLGKNSSTNKSKRLLSELSMRMRVQASGSREVIRLDYVPYMKELLLKKLITGDDDDVDKVIEDLDSCQISKEDLTETMESFKFPGIKRHSYSELTTKQKSTFTRKYNKAAHTAQAVVEAALASGKTGRKKIAQQTDDIFVASDAETEASEADETVDLSQFTKPKAKKIAVSKPNTAESRKRRSRTAEQGQTRNKTIKKSRA